MSQTIDKPGVYYDVPFAEYVRIPAVNWHSLEPYRTSPLQARHEAMTPEDATAPMHLGEAEHTAVLEPERFKQQYATMPEFEGHHNSNKYKAAKAAWIEANKASVALTQEEQAAAQFMSRAVHSHPVAGAVVNGRGRNELTVVWPNKSTLIKCRIDRVAYVPVRLVFPMAEVDGEIVCACDLKTTRMPWPGQFDKQLADLGYHGQFAMQIDGLLSHQPQIAPVHLTVAIQNAAPWDVAVYRLDDADLEHGRRLYHRLLATHLQCTASKLWPGCAPSIQTIILPKWAHEQEAINAD